MKLCRAILVTLGVSMIPLTVFAQENPPSGQAGSQTNPSAMIVPTGKIAVVNTGAFSNPEGGITQLVAQIKRVEDQFRERRAKLDSMLQRAQAITNELEKQGPNLTPEARARKQEELEELKVDGQAEQQKMDRDIRKALGEATEPVGERINVFLDNYCKQRGIVIVLEAAVLYQARGLAYVEPTLDITRDFIEAYNKSTATTSSASPGGAAAATAPAGTGAARPPAPKKP
ncbi:MAG: OmpH family outer membrane protein [Acidobacteria bacterium]|nr:OmpH family outer membrane protein [Acidobacteriota bacterium]